MSYSEPAEPPVDPPEKQTYRIAAGGLAEFKPSLPPLAEGQFYKVEALNGTISIDDEGTVAFLPYAGWTGHETLIVSIVNGHHEEVISIEVCIHVGDGEPEYHEPWGQERPYEHPVKPPYEPEPPVVVDPYWPDNPDDPSVSGSKSASGSKSGSGSKSASGSKSHSKSASQSKSHPPVDPPEKPIYRIDEGGLAEFLPDLPALKNSQFYKAEPLNGTISFGADGTVSFLPYAGWTGHETLTILIVDGNHDVVVSTEVCIHVGDGESDYHEPWEPEPPYEPPVDPPYEPEPPVVVDPYWPELPEEPSLSGSKSGSHSGSASKSDHSKSDHSKSDHSKSGHSKSGHSKSGHLKSGHSRSGSGSGYGGGSHS